MNRLFAASLALVVSLAAAPLPAAAPEPAPDTPAGAIRKLFVEGRWRDGASALERALAEDPANEELQFMAAMTAMERGDYAAAFRQYSKLLEKYPDNPGLKNNVAWLRIKAQDPAIRNLDLALREAQEAVMGAPHDYNIWNTLGEIYLVRGDPVRAMRYAVLARDLAALNREPDLRVYQDLINRLEPARNR